jgi:hypothetical protein
MFTITLTLNRAEMAEKLRALGELMRNPSPFLRAIANEVRSILGA